MESQINPYIDILVKRERTVNFDAVDWFLAIDCYLAKKASYDELR